MLRPEDCKPGVLVECIKHAHRSNIRIGAVYTVEGLLKGVASGSLDWIYGVWLAEMNEPCGNGCERKAAYALNLFRLVPDSRLDVFRAMLEPQEREVEHIGVVALEGV